jgi:hypothetical protein
VQFSQRSQFRFTATPMRPAKSEYNIVMANSWPTIQGDFWKIGRAPPWRPRPKKSNATDAARTTMLTVRFMTYHPAPNILADEQTMQCDKAFSGKRRGEEGMSANEEPITTDRAHFIIATTTAGVGGAEGAALRVRSSCRCRSFQKVRRPREGQVP